MLKSAILLIFCPIVLMQKMSDKVKQDLLTPLREYGETCGYESCPLTRPGALNVHIVPHTHLELGAYLTFDQHWTGEDDRYINKKQINAKKILDFVITELWNNPNRRFTLSDFAYLFYWWLQRDPTVHRMVYQLIRQGRLVLVGGGYSMSDEASVSYQAVVDQFTYSLRKINNTFMSCGRPLVAWQADAYGHSREFASLMAQMGFEAYFINPISYDDEVARMRRKALEFVWRGSDDLGAETDIYTHKLFDGYWSPPGFCFGKLCMDPLMITSDSLFLNVPERVDRFIELVTLRQAPHYNTRNIMVMMGHREAYFDAKTWFENIEKLIQFVNKKSVETKLNISLFYSSPMCYLHSVRSENPVLETKQDDFFPLVYDKDTYAVGMYSSRPTLKYIVREGYVFLQVAKQLQVTADLDDNRKLFEEFMWIMSVIQDHGIITGALRQIVKDYYVAKMYAAITKATKLISTAITKLRMSEVDMNYQRCMFNVSSCTASCYIKHSIQVYNPLGWPVTKPVRLSTISVKHRFRVYGPDGIEVKSVTMRIPEPVQRIKSRHPLITHEIVFIARDIPPIGYRSYFIESTPSRVRRAIIKKKIIATPKKYFNRQNTPSLEDQDKFPELDKEIDDDLSLNYTFNVTEDLPGKIDYEIDVSEEKSAESAISTTTTEMLEILRSFYDLNATKLFPGEPKRTSTTSRTTSSTTSRTTSSTTPRRTSRKTSSTTTTPTSTKTPQTEAISIEATITQPEIEIITEPEIEITTEPEMEITTEPEMEITTEPEMEITTAPEIETCTKPKIEIITAPKIKTTVLTTTTTIPTKTTKKSKLRKRIKGKGKKGAGEKKQAKSQVRTATKIPKVSTTVSTPNISRRLFDPPGDYDQFIGNKYVRVNLDDTNHVVSIHLCNGVNMSLKIQPFYYVSDDPMKLGKPEKKSPGAYVFRPMDPQREIIDDNFNATIVRNEIVEEILMNYNNWTFINLRLYADSPVLEVRWLVGPVPVDDGLGKDVFIRYATDLTNEGAFYTDSNGRQTIKRMRNMRATYEPVNLDVIAGNLYPVNSKIYIEDLKKNIRFSIFNDRSQAGGSIEDGTIDLMIHRRLLTGNLGYLDELEYGEGLRVLGSHYLYVTKADYKKNRIFEKKFAKEIELAPVVLVSDKKMLNNTGTVMRKEFLQNRNNFSALNKKLPVGVHLMTVEIWTKGILIRLENYLEKADSLKTGRKIVFVRNLFLNIDILSIRETTLAANLWITDKVTPLWEKRSKFYKNFNDAYGSSGNISYDKEFEPFSDEASLDQGISLEPQQIRTFVAEYNYVY